MFYRRVVFQRLFFITQRYFLILERLASDMEQDHLEYQVWLKPIQTKVEL